MIKKIHTIIILAFAIQMQPLAQELSDSAKLIKLYEELEQKMDSAAASKKPGLFKKVLNYFEGTNKEKEDKKLDFSVLGGPHYSNDSGFGVAILGSGLYYMNGCDSTDAKSTTSVFCDVTTKLNYIVGVEGYNIFPKEKYRLRYDLVMRHVNYDFYGIGYDKCSVDANRIKMQRTDFTLKTSFLARLCKSLYLGPHLVSQYSYADPKNKGDKGKVTPEYNYGKSDYQVAVGANLEFDTRDNIISAYKGMFFNTIYLVAPEWLGNRTLTHKLEANIRGYVPMWKGSVLAGEVFGNFYFGDISWIHLTQLAKQGRMRGYDTWRYVDRNTASAQVELRQHIYGRSGIVAWGGVGTSFHNKHTFRKFMPNYGFGYRWEFKKRVNVRLDYGIGKRCSSFIFAINEAF